MDENTLLKLKKVELEILDYFIEIAGKYNIKYFLIGGTLLGAIRHSGFIPWDDDIDIGVFRKDYDKLKDIFDMEGSSKYIYQCKENDERVFFSYAKLRKCGTQILEKENKNAKFFKGIFIDIFPLDNIPEKDNLIMVFEYNLFKLLYGVSMYKNGYREYKNILVKIICKILSIIPFKTINIISNNIMTKYKNVNTKYVTSYSSGYGYKKQRMNKEKIYGSGTLKIFENRNLNCPTDSHQYLKILFNNYMELPAINKRENHSIVNIEF